MKEKIEHFLSIMCILTKDEADLIAQVCKWEDDAKAAFLFAKNIFEEEQEE